MTFNPIGSSHRGGISRYRKARKTHRIKQKPMTFMEWIKYEWVKAGKLTDKLLGVKQ